VTVTGLELVRARLDQRDCRPGSGDRFEARCPVHDDRRASLSVALGKDGRVLLHCHAGCEPAAIVAELGLEWSDLYPEGSASNGHKEIVAEYDYTDEAGALLYQVVRFAPKGFRQRRPDGKGGWIWKLDKTRRVIYRLPAVIEAVQNRTTIYVVEGERDVLAIERAGGVATTNPGGAGKWREAFSKTLAGGEVVVVADRDEPGVKHAREVAASLTRHECTVRIVRAGEGLGKDATTHLAAGGTLVDFVEMPQEDNPGPTRDPSSLSDLLVEDILKANPDLTEEDVEGVSSMKDLLNLIGKKNTPTEIVELIEEAGVVLFHDRAQVTFASFDVDVSHRDVAGAFAGLQVVRAQGLLRGAKVRAHRSGADRRARATRGESDVRGRSAGGTPADRGRQQRDLLRPRRPAMARDRDHPRRVAGPRRAPGALSPHGWDGCVAGSGSRWELGSASRVREHLQRGQLGAVHRLAAGRGSTRSTGAGAHPSR
jgi:hypothetical protein